MGIMNWIVGPKREAIEEESQLDALLKRMKDPNYKFVQTIPLKKILKALASMQEVEFEVRAITITLHSEDVPGVEPGLYIRPRIIAGDYHNPDPLHPCVMDQFTITWGVEPAPGTREVG